MKEIPLTQGKIAIVDDEDYEWLMQHKWRAIKDHDSERWYAYTNVGKHPNRHCIRMHTLIIKPGKGYMTDHRDRDGLHNFRSNLRNCTRAQNNANSRPHKGTKWGLKGVSFDGECRVWRAKIKVNNKCIWLGSFKTILGAAQAYDKAAVQYFGEFACTNEMLGLLAALAAAQVKEGHNE